MTEWGLPGLQARFEFVQAGEEVELRLDLRFDPGTSGLTRAARNVWLKLRDRLAAGAGDGSPAAVSLVTSLASAPLTVTADGTGLSERFVDFVSQFAGLPPQADAPVVAALSFSLPKAGAADLQRDIFELDVRLEIGPVPIAIGMPKLDEDRSAVAFAAAFEEAWQGFDGAASRIALAAEDRPEGAAFWCVKAGAASGIALAAPAQADIAYYAVPPLSTTLISGTIPGDHGTEQLTAIDLDSWWDSFALGIDGVAAAIGPGELGDRFRRVRAALGAHLASRLRPVAQTELGDGLSEVRTVYGAAAQADLRCRVTASAAVDVRRGTAVSGEPAAVLHGRAMTWVEEAGEVAASPAAIRLTQGGQRLAYAVPASGEDGARRPSPIRFEAERIERLDDTPLRLLLPAPVVTDSLGLDLERPTAPAPLIRAPAPPLLSVAARTLGDSASVGGALAWSVEIETRARFAAQDRLELALGCDGEASTGSPESPAPHGLLFEALGRAVQAAASLPPEPDAAAIERFAALAEAVAEALPSWTPPASDVAALPGKWRYAVDFRDLPALIVSREAQESGPLPPWPAITGFVSPASEEESARYEPDPGAATDPGLRLSFTGLRLLADRSVRVHGRTSRNANIADSVEPAFVYPGTIESTLDLRPRLEWQAPQPEPRTERLEAALTALLNAIDEDSGAPYILGLDAGLLRPVKVAGISIRIPLLPLPGIEMGGEDGPAVADLAHELAGALSAARAGLDPETPGEEVALTVTLFDREPARLLLARLELRIAVPEDRSWWGDPRRGSLFS